jgi:IS30 family transposase
MSGGRKQAPRPVRAEFWEGVRSGLSPRDAGAAMGMRKGAERWFRLAGEVKGNGPGAVSGRYLSLAEREEIAVGLARGESYQVIGARIGRPASTISREVQRNGPRKRYRAVRAQALAEERARRPKTAKLAADGELRDWVQRHLEMKWSPEQISALLKREFPDRPEMRVSPETIYQSIYVQGRGALRRELAVCLR